MRKQYNKALGVYEDVLKKGELPGPNSAGQSGDTQGLSGIAESSSESVKELVEEGQYVEAAIVSGIEDAPDADEAEVHTKQVPQDDVPEEYVDADQSDGRDDTENLKHE